MKERVLVYISVIVCAFSFLSFRWPLDNPRITSTFGESRGDHFHDGIDIISSSRKVHPVSKGSLLYSWNKSLYPFDQYSGSGNYKVLSHQDNLVSVYLHLEDSEDIAPSYDENDSAASFGNTGRSYGTHLHFGLLDLKKNSAINPYEILPSIKDMKPPVVGPYAMRINDKIVNIRNKSKIHITRDWPLLVKIFDQISGGERLGIFQLKVSFNGELVCNDHFERIESSKNGLTISGKNFDNLYDKDGYYKIEVNKYRSGLNTFTVTASDFSGNQTVDTFTIDITLDK
jgi:hypothetical protein